MSQIGNQPVGRGGEAPHLLMHSNAQGGSGSGARHTRNDLRAGDRSGCIDRWGQGNAQDSSTQCRAELALGAHFM